MGDGPSSEDEDLLARLNALKHSHVFLESSPKASVSAIEEGADDTPEDLIARFQRIHGGKVAAKQEREKESSSSLDEGRPPSPTIEELLAELGSEEENKIDRLEIEEAQALMAEVSSSSLMSCSCCCVLQRFDTFHGNTILDLLVLS